MEQQASGMNSTQGSDGSLSDRTGAPGFGNSSFNQPVDVVGPQKADFAQPNERGVDGQTQGISPQPSSVR